MILLFRLIFHAKNIDDRVVVFSRSINTLDFIENTLKKFNKGKDQALKVKYVRFDGSTDYATRQALIDRFNNQKEKLHVFLISTLAGGEGINLCGANRVVLLDVNWNPSHDAEATSRSYRFGQKKELYIYRFITEGTMEEKIHQRQLKKEMISKWVVDDNSVTLNVPHLDKDLLELPVEKPISAPEIDEKVKDKIILQIVEKYPNWIEKVTLQNHLLTEDPTELLTDEEKQQAVGETEWDSVYGKFRRKAKSIRLEGLTTDEIIKEKSIQLLKLQQELEEQELNEMPTDLNIDEDSIMSDIKSSQKQFDGTSNKLSEKRKAEVVSSKDSKDTSEKHVKQENNTQCVEEGKNEIFQQENSRLDSDRSTEKKLHVAIPLSTQPNLNKLKQQLSSSPSTNNRISVTSPKQINKPNQESPITPSSESELVSSPHDLLEKEKKGMAQRMGQTAEYRKMVRKQLNDIKQAVDRFLRDAKESSSRYYHDRTRSKKRKYYHSQSISHKKHRSSS